MNNHALTSDVEIRVFHFFCGLGGGAKGFNRGAARIGTMRAKFRCLGGIDVDPASIRDFERLAGVRGTVLDLFSLEQYQAFHGKMPPSGWREAGIADIHRAAGDERPHIVFLSAPCKGFSGLLSETASKTAKYQALNGLTLRGVFLMLEAWKNDPPELIVFENVPRIAKRGRRLLDQIVALLRAYGYAVAETTHDCGVIGGLGQSRKRFLLVARHMEKVPPFLYEPPKHRLKGVGEVIGRFPVPGGGVGGPMHRVPSLQWKTWVRLAFVEAGSDWRSLNKLRVEDGQLVDFGLLPETEWQRGVLGVRPWDEPSGVVTGRGSPTTGTFAVADPRYEGLEYSQYGVRRWDETMGAVINVKAPGQGTFAVADPRTGGTEATHTNKFAVGDWDEAAGAVIGTNRGPGSGAACVADPRIEGGPRFNSTYRIVPFDKHAPAVAGPGGPAGGLAVADPRQPQRDDYKQTKYRVTHMEEPAGAVIAASTTGNGAFAIADPRPGYGPSTHHNIMQVHDWVDSAKTVTGGTHPAGGALSVADPRPRGLNANRDAYMTGGHYGVQAWGGTSGAVPGFGKYDRGPWSVADPREDQWSQLPAGDERLVTIIRALDGTWHRPFTTLELAALQGLVDPEEHLELDGLSDSAWRERIGNAVPPPAAEAIAGVMGRTLLLAWSGETFMLSSEPIWVQPIAVALMAAQGEAE